MVHLHPDQRDSQHVDRIGGDDADSGFISVDVRGDAEHAKPYYGSEVYREGESVIYKVKSKG